MFPASLLSFSLDGESLLSSWREVLMLPRTVLSPICVASITASPEVTTVPRKTLSSVKRSEESGSA